MIDFCCCCCFRVFVCNENKGLDLSLTESNEIFKHILTHSSQHTLSLPDTHSLTSWSSSSLPRNLFNFPSIVKLCSTSSKTRFGITKWSEKCSAKNSWNESWKVGRKKKKIKEKYKIKRTKKKKRRKNCSLLAEALKLCIARKI